MFGKILNKDNIVSRKFNIYHTLNYFLLQKNFIDTLQKANSKHTKIAEGLSLLWQLKSVFEIIIKLQIKICITKYPSYFLQGEG